MTLSAADRKEAEVLTVALVLVVAGLLSYSLWASMGYNDPKFKAYIQGRQYCDAFYGGNHETKQQLYADWKQSHGEIGC